jgi:hypothetical protein
MNLPASFTALIFCFLLFIKLFGFDGRDGKDMPKGTFFSGGQNYTEEDTIL